MLDIIFEEEPDLLPLQGSSQGVGVAHGSDTNVTVGNTTNEVLDPGGAAGASKGSRTVVGGDARNEVPVPGKGDVFIFIAFEIGVVSTVREMKTEWLELTNKHENWDDKFGQDIHSES